MLQLGAKFTPLAKPMPGDTSFQEHARIQGHPVKCQNTVLCFVQNARPTCVFPHKPDLSARIPSSKETPFCKDFFSYPLHHEFWSCSISDSASMSALHAMLPFCLLTCSDPVLHVSAKSSRRTTSKLEISNSQSVCPDAALAHSDLTILLISSNRT